MMKTYIAGTSQEIQNPDLTKGYTYTGKIFVGTEDTVMPGSVEIFPPDGLRERKDVYEECQFYRQYTEEELSAKNEPSQLDRIEAKVTYTAMMTDTLMEV